MKFISSTPLTASKDRVELTSPLTDPLIVFDDFDGIKVNDDLELRRLEKRDAPALFQLTENNREYLREWLPWVDSVATLNDTRTFIENSIAQFEKRAGMQLGIWLQLELVGVIGYYGIDWANRATSIGYWLSAAHQGKGIMTNSCKAFVDNAFSNFQLNRMQIRCATKNHKSNAIPKRLGFKQEGIIHQGEWLYDHYVDLIVYGMLTSEWSSMNRA